VPGKIRSILDQEYPGWELAPVSPEVRLAYKQHKAAHSPSITQSDFDHDGKTDYAVQIVLRTPGQEEQIVIVFLARDDGYEEIIVQSKGIDPTSSLWATQAAGKDALMVLGGLAGDTIYSYDDGRFHEIPSSEDPEHPDPSIPRVPPSSEKVEP
jgi:hypothetical protein